METHRKILPVLGNYRAADPTTGLKPDQTKTGASNASGLGSIIGNQRTKIGSNRQNSRQPSINSKKSKPPLQRQNASVEILPRTQSTATISGSTPDPLDEEELSGSEPERSTSIEDSSGSQGAQKPKEFNSKFSSLIPKSRQKAKKPKSAAERMFDNTLKEVKNTRPVFDSDNMEKQARAHRANTAISCKDIKEANTHAFTAFNKSAQEVFYELRMSDVFHDAVSQEKKYLGYMLPLTLEGYLWQLLDDFDAREKIKDCKLTPTEAVAIRFYGLQGFTDVQQTLRELDDAAPPEVFENLVKECCSALKKLPPLTEDTTLFRGTSHFDHGQAGQVYKDPAFTSTTANKQVAGHKFGGNEAGFFMLEIEVTKVATCRDISHLTGNKDEIEFLFPPDTFFKIDSITQGDEQSPTLVTLYPL